MPLPNEYDVHPDLRLGWQGPTTRPVLSFARYLAGIQELPVNPPTADFMSQVQTWCGRTNFKFGTCGPNMVANLFIMAFMYFQQEQVTVSDDAIYDLYRRSGNPGFDPATGADDNGVDNAVLFNAARTGGLDITRADGTVERHYVTAYGKLTGQGPNLVSQIKSSTALFGGACISVMLEIAQQSQTRANPPIWTDVPSSPDWGGHDIFGGRYLGDEGDDEQVVSWLVLVGIADGFLRRRAMECFCAIPDIALKHAPIIPGVNWGLLAQDFLEITGQTLDLSSLAS